MELCDKLISPILNYGSEVWGFHDAPEIEKVHLKFCKNILGVKNSVQNDFVYGELHRLPMKYARTVNILKYWLKIVHGEKNALCEHLLLELFENVRHLWYKLLGSLCKMYAGK